jgi:hypothetical protein
MWLAHRFEEAIASLPAGFAKANCGIARISTRASSIALAPSPSFTGEKTSASGLSVFVPNRAADVSGPVQSEPACEYHGESARFVRQDQNRIGGAYPLVWQKKSHHWDYAGSFRISGQLLLLNAMVMLSFRPC